ncbi:LysR family transcriptional regulator [Shimia sediminis]|uniref:LysR family transcriptional regulator n=1 Tax=Shimia sediminis TaxID=2497945 RepID=UPI000F8C90F1|nr:LysR family transcriptional regulator [Shimia sediminis]
MENLHLLNRFLVVARAGSIGKAARQLHITPPSLTKSIHSLEKSYGAELFERHSKGVSLSPFGERLLTHVQVIDREIQFAEAEVKAFREGQQGVLRIGAIPVWGYHLLPSAIAKMHQHYPAVRVDLSIGPINQLEPALRNGDIDILAGADGHSLDELPPFLEKADGPEIRIQLVANATHPCRGADPGRMLDYPWVMFGSDPQSIDGYLRRIEELTGGIPNFAMTSQSIIAVAEIIKSGEYITWLAEPVLKFLEMDAIQPIRTKHPFMTINSCLVYRQSLKGVASFNVLKRHCIS